MIGYRDTLAESLHCPRVSARKATIRPDLISFASLPFWWIWWKKFENITRVLEDSKTKVAWLCISDSEGLVKGLYGGILLASLHEITQQYCHLIGGLCSQSQNGDGDWSTKSAHIFWYSGPFEFYSTAYWSALHGLHPDMIRSDGCLPCTHPCAVPRLFYLP